ncbi:MAG: hypothetical protein BKP49_01720 [Treponema sp. CETP13]|nr:MAG: hypothetical protein BKP49_01720 [Treponema sp. CETP13]
MTKQYKKLDLAPYHFLVPSVGDMLLLSIVLIIPQLIMLFVTKSFSSIALVIIAVLSSFIADFLDIFSANKKYTFSWAPIYQGLIIGFFIPSGYPPVLAFCIILFILIIDKYAFGGFAQSWANPVMVTIIVMFFLGPQYFPPFILSPSFLQGSNAGSELFNQGILNYGSYDAGVTTFLNEKILSHFGISIPLGYVTLIWDTGSVIPAFRFNLLTLFASLFLLTCKTIEGLIPFVFLFVYASLVSLFGLFPYGRMVGGGDILLALLTSGTLFATFFLLEWHGTYPQSVIGKIIYAILAGVIAFIIIGCGASPVGILFTILVINVLTPLIQNVERSVYSLNIKKRIQKQTVEEIK